jgi:hypothetical protein
MDEDQFDDSPWRREASGFDELMARTGNEEH